MLKAMVKDDFIKILNQIDEQFLQSRMSDLSITFYQGNKAYIYKPNTGKFKKRPWKKRRKVKRK